MDGGLTDMEKEYATFVLRIFYGAAFLVAGLDKLFHYGMAGEMFGMWFGGLGGIMLLLAIGIEVGGGLALLSNFYTKYAAMLFIPFLLVATVVSWKIGGMDLFSTLREILVMNTAGGNTAVNFSYLAGITALALLACGEKKC